jgi:hypothetical protein
MVRQRGSAYATDALNSLLRAFLLPSIEILCNTLPCHNGYRVHETRFRLCMQMAMHARVLEPLGWGCVPLIPSPPPLSHPLALPYHTPLLSSELAACAPQTLDYRPSSVDQSLERGPRAVPHLQVIV